MHTSVAHFQPVLDLTVVLEAFNGRDALVAHDAKRFRPNILADLWLGRVDTLNDILHVHPIKQSVFLGAPGHGCRGLQVGRRTMSAGSGYVRDLVSKRRPTCHGSSNMGSLIAPSSNRRRTWPFSSLSRR